MREVVRDGRSFAGTELRAVVTDGAVSGSGEGDRMHYSLPTIDWVRLPTGADLDEHPQATQAIPDILRAAAAAGFGGVGVDTVTAADLVGGREHELAELFRAAGIRCTDVGVLSVGLSDGRESATALARLAARTGATSCVTVLDAEPTAAVVADLRSCAAVLAEVGARLALEFLPYSPLATLMDAIEVCAAVGWERCGLLVDTWHFFRGGAPWEVLARVTGDQVAMVQVNDAPPMRSDDLRFESRFRRVLPGYGEFDLQRFHGVLRASGYQGAVSPEVLSSELITQPLEVSVRALHASLVDTWPLGGPAPAEPTSEARP